MAAENDEEPEAVTGVPETLGDVLYATGERALVREEEWLAIVQRVAGGDQRALDGLYQRSHRLVFTLALRITSSRETAEEVTLDVFHDVWRKARDYDAANGPVIGWIMNQARSRAIDRLRLEQRKKRVNPQFVDPLPQVAADDPQDALLLRQLRSTLKNAVLALSVEERQAIEIAYFGELTHAEVAVRLNEPLGTIKTRIRSGLAKLRKALPET